LAHFRGALGADCVKVMHRTTIVNIFSHLSVRLVSAVCQVSFGGNFKYGFGVFGATANFKTSFFFTKPASNTGFYIKC
jgi:hypothetical protein